MLKKCMILFLLLGLALTVSAQDWTISYGETVGGTLNGFGGHRWTFWGNAGDVITISMVSESMDPFLELHDSALTMLTSDDDSGEYLNALISNFTLPSTGEYGIVARTADGNDTGSYGLSLTLVRSGGGSSQSGSTGKNPPTNFDTSGFSVNCQDGGSFDNGAAVTVIQMRSGFNYTATAVGINGFDPVLAVLDEAGDGLCTDDSIEAASYSANLPTTGRVDKSGTSSQVFFANNSRNAFADISLVVGGYNSQAGEFLLILEGMVFTGADNLGDVFSVAITPSMVASGVPITAYVISVTNAYDPLMGLIDADYELLVDDSNNYVACDDAGDPSLCWGDSWSLVGSYVSRTQGELAGGQYDAMLTLPLRQQDVSGFYNFFVNGAQGTYGDYVLVFHMGIGGASIGY